MVKIKTGGGIKIPPAQGVEGGEEEKRSELALARSPIIEKKNKAMSMHSLGLNTQTCLTGLSDTIIFNQIERYLGSKWNNVKFLHCGCTQSLRSHSPFLSLDNPQRHDDQSGTQWMKTKWWMECSISLVFLSLASSAQKIKSSIDFFQTKDAFKVNWPKWF